MVESDKINQILNSSPSVALLKLRNRELVIEFMTETFLNGQAVVSSDLIHNKLADFLDYKQVDLDEEMEIEVFDTYEVKARKYIRKWTDCGFLTNYQDDQGEVFYEMSSHASKTFDWLMSLEKKEFVGAESRFKDIFSQLRDLVEFTDEDRDKRMQLLEQKKLEIEQQINVLKAGEVAKVYEDYEIIPRFSQLTQSAKELLSDFKEVEDNFREITKQIYLKHAEGNLTKDHILEFTFDALDELKESQQGKSFYAFWSFLLNPNLQEEWTVLSKSLFERLDEKDIDISDFFLKDMKKFLHAAGQKVYKANDKMAEKLSRIIRENESSKVHSTRNLIHEIKTLLIEIGKKKQKPDIGFMLESEPDINLPFERKLTYEQAEEIMYKNRPRRADTDFMNAKNLGKLFTQKRVNRERIKASIKTLLTEKAQLTLGEIIEINGGLDEGLPELFGYLSVSKEFKHTINRDTVQRVVFDRDAQKSIHIPEVILTK
uniref:DUF3375 domain-containing protein n=1 Tax=Pedobacter schmidteae TaxID=2201271 RepID=UPI0018D50D87|nr:DUF3375 domain-containing protein [Pedobacter schmidteae]